MGNHQRRLINSIVYVVDRALVFAAYVVFPAVIIYGGYKVHVGLDYDLPDTPLLYYAATGDPFIDTEWWSIRKYYPEEWHYAKGLKLERDPKDYDTVIAWVWSTKPVIYISWDWYFSSQRSLYTMGYAGRTIYTDYGAILAHELRHVVQHSREVKVPLELREMEADAVGMQYIQLTEFEKWKTLD